MSYCMLDDEFEDPTIQEMSQVHIRAAVFAVHPSRGQWVRDAQGRLGVLAADADWRNDPLYNSMCTSTTEVSLPLPTVLALSLQRHLLGLFTLLQVPTHSTWPRRRDRLCLT